MVESVVVREVVAEEEEEAVPSLLSSIRQPGGSRKPLEELAAPAAQIMALMGHRERSSRYLTRRSIKQWAGVYT